MLCTYFVNEFDENGFNDISDLSDFANNLSNQVYGDEFASYTGNRFTVYTPAYFNTSLDFGLNENFYLNFNMSRRVMINPIQPEKENYSSVSFRYERNFMEFGIPFVMYENRDPRLGFWMRLGWLTLGSDHISSLVFKEKHFQGSDFYFAIRINDSVFRQNRRTKTKNRDKCYF